MEIILQIDPTWNIDDIMRLVAVGASFFGIKKLWDWIVKRYQTNVEGQDAMVHFWEERYRDLKTEMDTKVIAKLVQIEEENRALFREVQILRALLVAELGEKAEQVIERAKKDFI